MMSNHILLIGELVAGLQLDGQTGNMLIVNAAFMYLLSSIRLFGGIIRHYQHISLT